MDNLPSGRTRRFATRTVEPTQQLLVFCLRQDWFGLPVQFVHKVITLDQLYGTAPSGTSLTLHQDQEVFVLDVDQRIFAPGTGREQQVNSAPEIVSLASPSRRYLILVQNLQNELIGIPLDARPKLRKVPTSAFSPLSSTYLSQGNIRCVNGLVILGDAEPPIFLLDLNQLVQAKAALPAPES